MTNVWITGIGTYGPAGYGCARFASALRAGHSLVRAVEWPKLRFAGYAALAPALNFQTCFDELVRSRPDIGDATRARVLRSCRRYSRNISMSVLAAVEAFSQAGLRLGRHDAERTAVVAAIQNSSQRTQFALRETFDREPEFLSPEYAYQFLDTDHVAAVSEALDLRGEGFSIGAASAAGNLALLHGQRLIAHGYADVALVLGCAAELSPLELQALHSAGALAPQREPVAPDQIARPFDRAHQGFVPGEASACVVLESAQAARQRGATALAELSGVSCSMAASRAPSPDSVAESEAMCKALLAAGLEPAHIDYVNSHGTSSVAGDEAELRAIQRVFGVGGHAPFVNATKEIIGHCLWSAGVVEAVATVIQINGRFLHGNRNLSSPIGELRWVDLPAREVSVQCSLSNSFGFGGLHACVVLERSGLRDEGLWPRSRHGSSSAWRS